MSLNKFLNKRKRYVKVTWGFFYFLKQHITCHTGKIEPRILGTLNLDQGSGPGTWTQAPDSNLEFRKWTQNSGNEPRTQKRIISTAGDNIWEKDKSGESNQILKLDFSNFDVDLLFFIRKGFIRNSTSILYASKKTYPVNP